MTLLSLMASTIIIQKWWSPSLLWMRTMHHGEPYNRGIVSFFPIPLKELGFAIFELIIHSVLLPLLYLKSFDLKLLVLNHVDSNNAVKCLNCRIIVKLNFLPSSYCSSTISNECHSLKLVTYYFESHISSF